jgi:ABC-type polysaccharide/polyol phosphate transport system ATPase subunit
MTVRVAFSVAIAADPEVPLVDEVLGLGDQAFYARCLDRIRSLLRDGKTIVLASHSTALIAMLCQRALWIERGQVVKLGAAEGVVDAYKATGP